MRQLILYFSLFISFTSFSQVTQCKLDKWGDTMEINNYKEIKWLPNKANRRLYVKRDGTESSYYVSVFDDSYYDIFEKPRKIYNYTCLTTNDVYSDKFTISYNSENNTVTYNYLDGSKIVFNGSGIEFKK